ncbi:hypothetical protein AVV30_gp001 [Vibrio phage phi 1]|uniref:Uncharacterized protein n=1 Tax=Vibrio phage phi 1 TaxID=1589297 RepID=A0A0B5HAC2_9CAUD|nr:hypothetical protein AVV30_gp001 [Vibrio phage phi 1]AJF40659.1 hypothetical protein SBVP1_0001 [Vibrio phage phi 1]
MQLLHNYHHTEYPDTRVLRVGFDDFAYVVNVRSVNKPNEHMCLQRRPLYGELKHYTQIPNRHFKWRNF